MIRYRKRPLHKKRPQYKIYKNIVNKARKKGYKVLPLDRRQSTVDEVDIPEVYLTDGIIIPDRYGKERRDLIYIDDDAKKNDKIKAFAHELGHEHLFITGQDDESSNSNDQKIERKADKIGADILGMTVKEFNSPDVTYRDVKKGKHFFFDEEDDPIEETYTKEGRYMYRREYDD